MVAQVQPVEAHIEAYINGLGPDALNPSDTGFVDVCLGDSILFVATPFFPNSLENTGTGYSQDVNSNINFTWSILDGNSYPNNDSIWFIPGNEAGYFIGVDIEDLDLQSDFMRCITRVGISPSFNGAGPLNTEICIGDTNTLIGGMTIQDTVGIHFQPILFDLDPVLPLGSAYLPDGSGAIYTSPITISGFPSGAVISDTQDLNYICLTMEHSYLGDLEVWLECPNGNTVTLINSYNPGSIPGGINGH